MVIGKTSTISRRKFIQLAILLGCGLPPNANAGSTKLSLITKVIPGTQETIPVIGMGSWITFDLDLQQPDYDQELRNRIDILKTFFEMGGGMIDSSPMYGQSEYVIGRCLEKLNKTKTLFAATKVWVQGQWLGKHQMEQSRQLWGINRFELMQIHNMVDWQDHLETLKQWKQDGKIRYIGITTSHGRRHHELEKTLTNESFDFVQLTYNLIDREAENRLLPITAEKNIAVIANRPFQGGDLFNYVRNKALPKWAGEFNCQNWAQFFLKFIVSHPNIQCAIPATSQVAHMKENMGACSGDLPDTRTRRRMLDYFNS